MKGLNAVCIRPEYSDVGSFLARQAILFILAGGWLGCLAEAGEDLPGRIDVVLIERPVIHYATFQSHNQKVVEIQDAIYATYLRTANAEHTHQKWRLIRSRDQGRSFEVLLDEAEATNPPVLEGHPETGLYLMRVDLNSGDAFCDHWQVGAEIEARTRKTTRIPFGAAGKFAALLDYPRRRLYFFSHNGTFHRLSLDGELIDSREIIASGPHAALQYPLLTLAPDGTLHLAWTTVKHGEYLYWDIHHAFSRDGGDTFLSWPAHGATVEGQPDKLELPIIADDTGRARRVTADDEFVVHTWLASCAATQGYWHGFYLCQMAKPRLRYVKYDWNASQPDSIVPSTLAGTTIRLLGLDGFFAVDPQDGIRIFAIGQDRGHVACLVSHDQGRTWHDYARSEMEYSLYAPGGYRWLTSHGDIIGTFTDYRSSPEPDGEASAVYFFRIHPAE